jgi:hypothetical protein
MTHENTEITIILSSKDKERLNNLQKLFPGLSHQGIICLAIDFLCNDHIEAKEGYKDDR